MSAATSQERQVWLRTDLALEFSLAALSAMAGLLGYLLRFFMKRDAAMQDRWVEMQKQNIAAYAEVRAALEAARIAVDSARDAIKSIREDVHRLAIEVARGDRPGDD